MEAMKQIRGTTTFGVSCTTSGFRSSSTPSFGTLQETDPNMLTEGDEGRA